jgi:hypothetical protein
MSIDVDVLCETFILMKEYISSKDRQAVADHLFSILSDMDGITEKDLKSFAACDTYLQRASEEYFVDDSDGDEDYDNYDQDD